MSTISGILDNYNFKPAQDKFAEHAAVIASFALYTGGMLLFLNPVFVGIALCTSIGAAFTLDKTLKKASKEFRKDTKDTKDEKDVDKTPAQLTKIKQMVNELSKEMGLKHPPQVIIQSNQKLRARIKNALPWWKKPFINKEKKEENINHSLRWMYGAGSNINIIIVSENAVRNPPSDATLKFIIAHELSHIKAQDSSSLRGLAHLAKPMNELLCLGGIVVGLGVALFSAAPLMPMILGAAALPVLKQISALPLFFATRVIERRADRNALRVTQDFNAASQCIKDIHPAKAQKKKLPYYLEILTTHPPYHKRINNLQGAWKKVAHHATPKNRIQNAQPTAKQPALSNRRK